MLCQRLVLPLRSSSRVLPCGRCFHCMRGNSFGLHAGCGSPFTGGVNRQLASCRSVTASVNLLSPATLRGASTCQCVMTPPTLPPRCPTCPRCASDKVCCFVHGTKCRMRLNSAVPLAWLESVEPLTGRTFYGHSLAEGILAVGYRYVWPHIPM